MRIDFQADPAYIARERREASLTRLAEIETKAGTVSLGAGGSAAVTFATPFARVPVVTVTAQFNNADTSCTYSAHSITVNGFTIRGAGNPAGVVGWIATDAGNP